MEAQAVGFVSMRFGLPSWFVSFFPLPTKREFPEKGDAQSGSRLVGVLVWQLAVSKGTLDGRGFNRKMPQPGGLGFIGLDLVQKGRD